MARRKNTAEAFEILAEIAREKEGERKGKSALAAQPAAEAPSNFRLLSREPLLKAPGGAGRQKWRWKESPRKSAGLAPTPREEAAARPLQPEILEIPAHPAPRPPARDAVERAPPKPERRQPFLARWCSERPRPAVRAESVPVMAAARAAPPAPDILSGPAAVLPAPWSEMGEVEAAPAARPMRIDLLEAREPPARFDPDPWIGSPPPAESRDRALVSGGGGHPGPACAARGDDAGLPPLPKPARESAARPDRPPPPSISMASPPAPEPTRDAASEEHVESRDGGEEVIAPELPELEAGGDAPTEEPRPRARPGVVVIGSGWLERAIEVRLSTALALGMFGLIAIVLFLTYLELPPAEDATLRNFMVQDPGAVGASSPSPGEPLGPEEPAALPQEAPPLEGLARPVPIWSPRTVSPEGTSRDPASPPTIVVQGEAAAPPPEIRNIETVGEAPDGGAAAAPDPGGSTPLAARESAGVIHRIQVRAKESRKGAQQIVAYLAQFGFDPEQALIERDRHGDKNAEGIPLYTVFVGAYESRDQALPHLEKLKDETRLRPFQDRPAFRDMFHDALVVRRRQ